ncbi:rhamnan synthesis F family protein [Hydrogenophaga sp.]|uniref:rhamnan synthesis F family protein n=1 Tax=Hydrogenophaga sp. TaxID=1904254 RepID=UPI0027322315|nr:rhamnan synthesis F family protein [Hydrogenophaga sp.]MDP2018955.1 rhamnan synthesis F family protein [Hydrogenophaga sp.]MDP3164333.1 rhamnan synthesis F family protein [Hydrogenophaga sp.]MDP3812408.1 rhamnan synthesis F family protein [Hydrogenophaga sp.]
MIPAWKVRRELETLRQQLQAIPERLIGPSRQRRLDSRFPVDYRILSGAATLGRKVAIFLVYQPHGMSASAVATCRHLAERGYSVVLVANSPVSASDEQALGQWVWRFVERPNFGYDFGGYRDGIRLLWHWSVSPDSLIILNDSVWFPLDGNETMLSSMETSNADFLGALRHVDLPDTDTEHAGIFLSYFFLIKRPVLTSDVFVDYWNNYVSTSNKHLTVRRGERGFSRTLFAAGVKSEGLYSRDRFMAALELQPAAFLRQTLVYGAYTDPDLEQARDVLLQTDAASEAWKMQAINHIRLVVNKRNFHSSFCFASIRLLGIPLLKKNKGELQVRMRRQYLRAVEAGDLPSPEPAVLAEIEASTR